MKHANILFEGQIFLIHFHRLHLSVGGNIHCNVNYSSNSNWQFGVYLFYQITFDGKLHSYHQIPENLAKNRRLYFHVI